jgi:hypothetical protein
MKWNYMAPSHRRIVIALALVGLALIGLYNWLPDEGEEKFGRMLWQDGIRTPSQQK